VDEDDVKQKLAPPLAILNSLDPVVECIQNRAQDFLGSMASPEFELLSLSRYNVSHQVQPHLDASIGPMVDPQTGRKFNRRTSFFVYVHASPNLEGGETFFPRIPFPHQVSLSNPAICMRNNASGVPALSVKPVSGSAIFWVGLKPDESPDHETWHEGLAVRSGVKLGMNIWARHYLD
jgi:prolyl 4-hydroxylase